MGFADSNGILTGLLAQPAALAPGQSLTWGAIEMSKSMQGEWPA